MALSTLKTINPIYADYVPESKVELTRGLMLSPPYTDWDIQYFSIDAPKVLNVPGVKTVMHTCAMWYLYDVNGKRIKGRFRLEGTRKDDSLLYSTYGISEITEPLTPEEEELEKKGAKIERKKTGKYQIRIVIPASPDECKSFRRIIDDIYDVAAKHLYKYGSSDGGNKTLKEKYLSSLERPSEEAGPDNAYESLKYPIFYQKKKVPSDTGMVDRCDFDVPGSIGASVGIPKPKDDTKSDDKKSEFETVFILDDGTKYPSRELIQKGFRFSPELSMSLFIGAKTKLKITLVNGIIAGFMETNAVGRLDALAERHASGVSTSEAIKNRSSLRSNTLLANDSNDPLEKEKVEEARLEQERRKKEEDDEHLQREQDDRARFEAELRAKIDAEAQLKIDAAIAARTLELQIAAETVKPSRTKTQVVQDTPPVKAQSSRKTKPEPKVDTKQVKRKVKVPSVSSEEEVIGSD